MEMSITRALSELKLLNNRIESTINDSTFVVANKKSATKVNNLNTKEEFIKNAKSDYQSILDLIERRKKIKSAIVASNAVTKVVISNKEMTVAEAIERKDSISFDKNLYEAMHKQLRAAMLNANQANQLVQNKLDDLLTVSLGKENKSKASEEDILAITKPYLAQNEVELINPLLLEDKIKVLKLEIDTFESEVDFILSESNTITKIQID